MFRRPFGSRPIRLFLISMFAVPLVSLVGLWVFAASITVSSAVSNHNYNTTTSSINASIAALSTGLPAERAESYLWLVTDRLSPKAPLLAARNAVNKGLPATQAALEAQLPQLTGAPKAALTTLLSDIAGLGQIRQEVDAGTMSPAAAFQAYTSIIDDEFQYFYAAIQDKSSQQADVSIGAVDGDYALEMTSREETLIDGALAAGGQLSAPVRQLFVSSAGGRQLMLAQALSLLTPSLRVSYLAVGGSPVYQQFQSMENQILDSTGAAIPVNATAWESGSAAYLTALQGALTKDGLLLASDSASLSDTLLTEAILAGGLGLVAVVGSVFLLIWFGRKVTGDLTRLHGSVRDMAEERLPRVVDQLRRGVDVDVHAESPPPSTSTIQEISQIAESFATVQEAAVTAAVDQARLRKGVNQVFLNISMRNQSLLHRQLAMLDSMERGTSEPTALADLFRLDHLTTRMRRHAEGLIILSGATPGRGWRDPVPVVDVLRAAVAEVESYLRVDVVSESRDLVVGSAVGDVIHLTAELVENATVFSPPNTRIEVRADRVGTGLVVEIEDRGLGLSDDERADINRRLASSPEFDLANSEQLGLFVVSQLAARHNIKVSLRESMYGGTTAVLLLPFGVIVREEEAWAPRGHDDWPDLGASNGQNHLARRHRLLTGAPDSRTDSDVDEQDWQLPLGPSRTFREIEPPPQARPQPTFAAMSPPGVPPWDPEAMTPWPEAFQPRTDLSERSWPGGPASTDNARSAGAPPRSSAGSPGEVAPAGPPSSGTHLGMPIRVPQASLAPQLQSHKASQQETVRDAAARSPEANRDLMILMQQGWQRGRADDLDNPEGAPGNGMTDSEAGNGTD
jgi:signal transduction histidine kinase